MTLFRKLVVLPATLGFAALVPARVIRSGLFLCRRNRLVSTSRLHRLHRRRRDCSWMVRKNSCAVSFVEAGTARWLLPEWCYYEPPTPLILPLPVVPVSSSTLPVGSVSATTTSVSTETTALSTETTPASSTETTARPILSVVAPMVSASDYAFRCLTRQYDADLTFTQMLHARNLNSDETFYRNHWDLYEYQSPSHGRSTSDTTAASRQLPVPVHRRRSLLPSQTNFFKGLDDCNSIDGTYLSHSDSHPPPCATATRGPVIAQLAGNTVTEVVPAALKLIASTNQQLAGIDFNLGCPQGIARKGHYGAFLMEQDEETVYTILTALRRAVPEHVAVSAKIRLPRDPSRQEQRLRRLCDTGLNFITVHGRDWTENKSTVSAVHLDRLATAVETIQQYNYNIPVIVNGGIETGNDIHRILQYTKASAVMSSEALLERPWLFQRHHRHPIDTTPRLRFKQQLDTAATYLRWCRYAPPVPGVLGIQGGSFNVVRGHLFKLLYPYLNEHLDLRDDLANNFTFQQLTQAIALLQQMRDRYERLSDAEWESLPSSQHPESSWYRRHWTSSSTSALEPSLTLSLNERKEAARLRIAQLRERKSATAAIM